MAGGAQGAPAPVGAPTAAPSSVPAPPPRQRHSLPIHVPFSLINLFLELEKRRRFDQVEDKVTQMEDLVKNFGRLPHDSDDPLHHLRRHHRSKSTTNNTNSGGVRMTPANEEDPSNLVGLYLDVGHIRNGLEAWKAQMAGMVPFVGEMVGEDGVKKKKRRTRTTATRSAMDEDTESDDDDNEENEEDAVVFGGGTLDPAEYLQRTRDEYDVKIGKCAMVMEGTSLTFQMVSHSVLRPRDDGGLKRKAVSN